MFSPRDREEAFAVGSREARGDGEPASSVTRRRTRIGSDVNVESSNALLERANSHDQAGYLGTSARRGAAAFPREAKTKQDTLGQLLENMCLTVLDDGEKAMRDDSALRDHVETESRGANPTVFAKFSRDVHARVQALMTSDDVDKKLGGLRAIDQLIEIEFGEDVEKVKMFADYLLNIMTSSFQQPLESMDESGITSADASLSDDPVWIGERTAELVELTSAVLGRLVLHSGALTTEIVDSQVQRAIQLLGTKDESQVVLSMKRYAASLTLMELARNAPTIFNVHVPVFVSSIWSALRDPSLMVREMAVGALRECLVVTEQRETRYRVQWYYELYEACRAGLKQKSKVEEMHGSLLVFGELLRRTGEFMLSRYREVAETVLRLQSAKESIIRRTIVSLIPKLATFSPQRFADSYLVESCALILTTIRSPSDRSAGFKALSKLAAAMSPVIDVDGDPSKMGVGSSLLRYLPEVSAVMYDLFTSRTQSKNLCPEALRCAGALMDSLGDTWKPHLMNLLPAMFTGGLSEALVLGLESVAKAAPDLMPVIQQKLAESIAQAIRYEPSTELSCSMQPKKKIVQIALRTMRTFPFESAVLLRSIKKNVVVYLNDSSAESRLEAALTCCGALRLRVRSSKSTSSAVEQIMEALIPVAVGDSDSSIRTALLTEFCRPSAAIDSYLSQARVLRALFVTLTTKTLAYEFSASTCLVVWRREIQRMYFQLCVRICCSF